MNTLKNWLKGYGQRFARVLLEPVALPIIHELQRTNLPAPRRPTNPLLVYGCRYFSQNDEDGILLEILRRVEIEAPLAFLELGVGDGTECNTIILLAKGWCGAWAGAEPLSFDVPAGARLVFSNSWITKHNAAVLAGDALGTLHLALCDVRVASVDLDGNDGHVVRTLLAAGLSPDVFIVEYNAKFPPDIEFEMPYNEKHEWQRDDYQGVSLQRWLAILPRYKLVACNDNGVNAFFVKEKYADLFSDVPNRVEDIYRIGHYHPVPGSGHRTSPRTVRHLAVMDPPMAPK